MSLKSSYCVLLAICLLSGLTNAQDKEATGKFAVFNFTVTSMSGKPRQGELIMVKGSRTKKTIKGNIGEDGTLTLNVPAPDTYAVYFRLITDTIKYKDVKVLESDRGSVYQIELKHDPGRAVTLKNVYFETGLSSLKKESYPALDELVDVLKSSVSMCIEIAGHTDNVGSAVSNQKLSQDRANTIRTYLVRQGIDPKRVVAKGYGDTRPVALNETAEDRQKNRRTEVRIISE